mmetsp:Transcript_1830/g.3984  ORF Transcript_1830/g.3984 Transcript_1830/m.3984 type:complete len:560 (-) Transcript_1830:365-2044(-)
MASYAAAVLIFALQMGGFAAGVISAHQRCGVISSHQRSSPSFIPLLPALRQRPSDGRLHLARRSASTKLDEEKLRNELASRNVDAAESALGEVDVGGGLLKDLVKPRPYAAVVTQKFIENVDDFLVSLRQRPSARGAEKGKRERIVVLGTGWGSHAFLSTVDASKYEVIVISPRNFFLFTPMLAGAALGTVEYRSITDPIRNVNPLVDYYEATCTDIDPVKKTVACQSVVCEGTSCTIEQFEVPYDRLLIGVGAQTATYNIPGVKEHCQFLKQVGDAKKLRRAIGNVFERANIPGLSDAQRQAILTFVVVGAGPTGVELMSELLDFVEQDVPRYYPHLLQHVRVKLVEATDTVLMAFDESLRQKAAERLLSRPDRLVARGLLDASADPLTEIKLQAGVKEITDTEVVLTNGDRVAYGLVVWAAGNGPLPLVLSAIDKFSEQKAAQSKARGRLVVDPWLRVKGADDIFAIGDCTLMDETPLPATAQVASQQGAFLGRLLNHDVDLRAHPIPKRLGRRGSLSEVLIDGSNDYPKAFQFLNLGILAYTGDNSALAQVQVRGW